MLTGLWNYIFENYNKISNMDCIVTIRNEYISSPYVISVIDRNVKIASK